MILDLLTDERTEVRESTAETLSGLMHCEFVKIDDKLIKNFESKSNHKLNRIDNNGKLIIDPKDLTLRHSGILGLCACINAFPYDVPDFMPDILVFLSNHMSDPQPIPVCINPFSLPPTYLSLRSGLVCNQEDFVELPSDSFGQLARPQTQVHRRPALCDHWTTGFAQLLRLESEPKRSLH